MDKDRTAISQQRTVGRQNKFVNGSVLSSSGIVSGRRKWIEEENKTGPSMAVLKNQGELDGYRKWVEKQKQRKLLGNITNITTRNTTSSTTSSYEYKKPYREGLYKTNAAPPKLKDTTTSSHRHHVPRPFREDPRKYQKGVKAGFQPIGRVEKLSGLGEGCYLTFETDSGGKLMLRYQKSGQPPNNVVGFWRAGGQGRIQEYKFKQGGGRCELIRGIAGGDQNRRKYFNGWCQFLKLAKQMRGMVTMFKVLGAGVQVDVYAFDNDGFVNLLNLESGFFDVSNFVAVAVVPSKKDFLQGVKTVTTLTFLEMGAIAGFSTRL